MFNMEPVYSYGDQNYVLSLRREIRNSGPLARSISKTSTFGGEITLFCECQFMAVAIRLAVSFPFCHLKQASLRGALAADIQSLRRGGVPPLLRRAQRAARGEAGPKRLRCRRANRHIAQNETIG